MRIPKVAAFLAILLAGCGTRTPAPRPAWNGKLSDQIPEPVRTALEQAPQFELLSLDPKHRDQDKPKEFYQRRIVGKTIVKDAATRNRLLGALDAGVRESHESSKCFNPRHAIRVEHLGKKFYPSICFHCSNVYVLVDDKGGRQHDFGTSNSPLTEFDDVLKAAGVPLAEDGELGE